jgi:hypothetical protein
VSSNPTASIDTTQALVVNRTRNVVTFVLSMGISRPFKHPSFGAMVPI